MFFKLFYNSLRIPNHDDYPVLLYLLSEVVTTLCGPDCRELSTLLLSCSKSC